MKKLRTAPNAIPPVSAIIPLVDAIPTALKNFDSLPNSANVRQAVVEALFACSGTTIWRMVKRGDLKPRRLSPRVTSYNVGDVRAALSKVA